MIAETRVMSYAPPVSRMDYGIGYIIARYLRISHEDGKDESNSITNQRAMIQNFIEADAEFSRAQVIDYIDDGVSGSHTDREAYQRLMDDVRLGNVHCIIVKDLSRIGRNLIEVDDLLMNELVARKVRFIAINNYYDSLKHPLSNLELAVINLANQHYNKDLAVKSITSRRVKMKKGEYMSCFALFGYNKSVAEKNKLEIDGEAAEYVRLIFSLAMDGHNLTQIARILNAQGVPTPSEYKKRHGIMREWNIIDPDYSFWCNALVGRLLHDERYTGKAISNMYRTKTPGKKNCLLRPREEWIIVPGAHEAIISETDYQKAHAMLKRAREAGVPVDHIFWGKVKCPVCRRTMIRSSKINPHFKCGTKRLTDHYGCPDISVSQEAIEKVVLESIRIYAVMLVERETLRLDAIQKEKASKGELARRIQVEEKAIRLLEESITKNFMAFASDEITQDAFMDKKKVINETVDRKKSELDGLHTQLAALQIGKGKIVENLAEYQSWQTIETLNREIVDLMIDSILVHDEQQIEVVWADRK